MRLLAAILFTVEEIGPRRVGAAVFFAAVFIFACWFIGNAIDAWRNP